MSWWRRQRREPTPAPAAPSQLADDPLSYAVLRVGDRWLLSLCDGRVDAIRAMEAVRAAFPGAYVLAGEAPTLDEAHWQVRAALRQPRRGQGPLPWTAYPQDGDGAAPLLRASFEQALNMAGGRIASLFYAHLFAAEPSLRRYFRHNLEAQERVFGEHLADIVLHLEDLEPMRRHLVALGARHATYGVTAEMIGPVRDVLIETLEEAGGGWGEMAEELRAAWRSAINAVADIMLSGFPAE